MPVSESNMIYIILQIVADEDDEGSDYGRGWWE